MLLFFVRVQENDRQVEEWVHYLSQVKRSRGKQYFDLPSIGDRSKVQQLIYFGLLSIVHHLQTCFTLNNYDIFLVAEKRTT